MSQKKKLSEIILKNKSRRHILTCGTDTLSKLLKEGTVMLRKDAYNDVHVGDIVTLHEVDEEDYLDREVIAMVNYVDDKKVIVVV